VAKPRVRPARQRAVAERADRDRGRAVEALQHVEHLGALAGLRDEHERVAEPGDAVARQRRRVDRVGAAPGRVQGVDRRRQRVPAGADAGEDQRAGAGGREVGRGERRAGLAEPRLKILCLKADALCERAQIS
jgi:hypothetical protein